MHTLSQALLIALPIKLMFQHYFEFTLLLLTLAFYQRLKKKHLGFLPLFFFGFLILDLALENSGLRHQVYVNDTFGFVTFLMGLYVLPALQKKRLTKVLLLLIYFTALNVTMRHYGIRGWYNVFIYNLTFPLTLPVFYLFFSGYIKFKRPIRNIFLLTMLASEIFFVYDYLRSDNILINYKSSSVFFSLLIAMNCLVLFKALAQDEFAGRLTNTPVFWVCSAIIVFAVIKVIVDGLHSYLVKAVVPMKIHIVLLRFERISYLIFELGVFYSFCLCAKYESARLRIRLFKKKRNQSIHYDTVTITPKT